LKAFPLIFIGAKEESNGVCAPILYLMTDRQVVGNQQVIEIL